MPKFKTTTYHLVSTKFTKMKRLTIALLTDLHNKSYGNNNIDLLSAIHRASPDLILSAGDLLVSRKNQPADVPVRLLQNLAADYPVYCSSGNHETKIKERSVYGDMHKNYRAQLTHPNIHFLDNDHLTLNWHGTQVMIHGLELPLTYYKRFSRKIVPVSEITGALGSPNTSDYHILLAHNPVHFKSYASWGADLTLSGHLHGGIIRIPGIGGLITPQVRFFPKYDAGLFRENNKTMIVSRGLGDHAPSFRLFNPRELIIITIDPPALIE